MTHVHFIGVGGSGLSAIARLLLEQGYRVSGSDRAHSTLAAELVKIGATITIGHNAANITGADWVVRSSAVADDNPEVVAARTAGLPVYKRADFLGQLMAPPAHQGIAVAGTHGKTTTTAMIAWMLAQLGADPSFIIGGVSQNFGVNARAGSGTAFVIEADEYDRMFLGLQPRYAVITNVEHDHPDIYPSAADFFEAFRQFIRLVPANGALIACADDQGAALLAEEARTQGTRVISYQLEEQPGKNLGEWIVARKVRSNQLGGFTFEVTANLHPDQADTCTVQLRVPGLHNVRNALAALGIASLMNFNLTQAALALGEFTGTGRRFEIIGEAGGIVFIDDYAHHPTEIRATLAAARARYPLQRIWAVWQPHTYSRTQTLFKEFTGAFGLADEVIVSEIYAAREPSQDFSAAQVVAAMDHKSAHFIATLADIGTYLLSQLQPGDVLIVMSAGDADQINKTILAQIQPAH